MQRIAIVATLSLALASPGPAAGQETGKASHAGISLAGISLAGMWKLVSITAATDGKVSEPWGANPSGILVLEPGGRFSQIQMRSDRPKFQSSNRLKGTDEENRATAQGVLAYYGTWTLDEGAGALNFSIEASSFPNQNGTTGSRPFVREGEDLIVVNPGAASGPEIRLRWRRL